MANDDLESTELRATALENARTILAARQRAEGELAETVAALRATLEATTDAVIVTDRNARITHHNRRYAELWIWVVAPLRLGEEALALLETQASATAEDLSILDASRALVEAHAYVTLGFLDRATERLVAGVAAARRRDLEFDLARLLLLADEIGVDPEPAGSARPRDEAEQILCRLGVTS